MTWEILSCYFLVKLSCYDLMLTYELHNNLIKMLGYGELCSILNVCLPTTMTMYYGITLLKKSIKYISLSYSALHYLPVYLCVSLTVWPHEQAQHQCCILINRRVASQNIENDLPTHLKKNAPTITRVNVFVSSPSETLACAKHAQIC
jgi:hypothetical protein